ncbi:MAG: hypothetical protein AB7S26_28960 [Sandaracinaceae bacterium]
MLHKAFAPEDVLCEGEPGARTTLEPPKFIEARLREVARTHSGELVPEARATSTLLRRLVLAWAFVALVLGAALGYAVASVS